MKTPGLSPSSPSAHRTQTDTPQHPLEETLKSAIQEKDNFLPALLWIILWTLLSVILSNGHTRV